MPNSATITGTSGPGKTATAVVINNVTNLSFNFGEAVLFVSTSDFPSPRQFALTGSNTFTLTASGGSYTFTMT